MEKLGLARSALRALDVDNPVALAAARSLLGERDLDVREARVRLRAELLVLEEVASKGRGGKALQVPPMTAPPGQDQAAGAEQQTGGPSLAFDQLHPRGTGGTFVRKGDSGPHVAAMQQRLGELGFPAGTDGKFSGREQRQVMALQKQHGIPATGVVDQRTLELMRMPPSGTHTESSAQLRAALLAAGQTSKPGDVGPNVQTLQTALGALGFQITDPAASYGASTESAVRQLQTRAGLAPTGRMDEQTAALLASATPGRESHGNVAGDDAATWGLKPKGRRGPGRMTDKPSGGTANPRRKPSPTRGAAGGGKGGKVKEATYDSASGGVDPFVATVVTAARALGPIKPPGLREAEEGAFVACASCVWFAHAACDRYGGYRVGRDDLCDDYRTLTPERDRPDGSFDNEGDMDEGEREVLEVKSTAYPGLDRSPKQNWVDKAGGLPSYIERIAKHLHYEKGKSISTAIAIAVNTVKRWCAGGPSTSAKTKTQACAAVAQWEAKKAKSHVSEGVDLEAVTLEEALADVGLAVALAESADAFSTQPSLRFCGKLLAEVQEAYDDWDDPPREERAAVIFAQEAAWRLAAASYDEAVEPFMRVVEGTPVLFVAGCPVRTFGSVSEAQGQTAAAATYSVGVRRKNAKRTKERTHGAMRRGFHEAESEHNPADLDVHAVVSKRFAGAGATPRHLAADAGGQMKEGDSTPELEAGSGDGARRGGAAGRRSVREIAEAMFPQVAEEAMIGHFDPLDHPRGRGGEFRERFGHAVAGMADRIAGAADHGGVKSPPSETKPSSALAVDQAIGKTLSSYPGLTDWKVEKHEDEWHLHVTMPSGTHVIHVTGDGDVHLEADHGKPAVPAGGYELTGEQEKPYHMADGQVFQGKKGGWFTKLEHGKMTSVKGWTGAGVHIHDHQTGESKWLPAFAMKDPHELAGPAGAAKPEAAKPDGAALFGELMTSVKGDPAANIRALAKKVPAGGYHAVDAKATDALDALEALPEEHYHHLSDADLKRVYATSEDANWHTVAGRAWKVMKMREDGSAPPPGGSTSSAGAESFHGKNVVVTGKIPGYTRDEVHDLLKAKGATPHKTVASDTHMLIAGEKVGETKTAAAAKKGVQVVGWHDVKHLLEAASVTSRAARLLEARAALAGAAGVERDVLLARMRVLEARLDDGDRDSLRARGSGLERFGVLRIAEARVVG